MYVNIRFERLHQYIAALTVSIGAFVAGTVAGWTGNSSDALFAGEYNNIPIDLTDLGWIASLPNLAATVFTFPSGILCDKFGRKPTLLLLGLFMILGWLLLVFANSIIMILIARFVVGIGTGASFILIPLYNVEIAEKEIRARLASFIGLFFTTGILFSYILGYALHIKTLTIICAVIPVLFIISLLFQDETPIYQVRQNNCDGARKTLKRLRGQSYDVDAEIEEIKMTLQYENKKTPIRECLKLRSTKIATLVTCGLLLFQHLGGATVVIFYANEIFTSAGSTLDPSEATMVLGAIQVVSALTASTVMDLFRRKVLLVTSFLFTSGGLIILGTYFLLKDRHLASQEILSTLGFLPILGLSIFTLMSSLGVAPLYPVLAAELYPSEIKASAISATGTLNWLIVTLVSRFYGDLKSAVGGDITFYSFGGVCLLGAIFTVFVVPETKNKSLEQIQRELNKKM